MCGAAAAAEANKLKQATNFTYNTDSAVSKHLSHAFLGRAGFIYLKKSTGTNRTSHRTIPSERYPEKKKKKKEITQTVKPVTEDPTFNEHSRL